MSNLCKVRAVMRVTTLTFPYRVEQTKYSEMNNIMGIIRTALCLKQAQHIIRFPVCRSLGTNTYLKLSCSKLFFLYFCHKNYSNFTNSFLRICFMLTILKDLNLLNAIVLQLCTLLIPAHQKAG